MKQRVVLARDRMGVKPLFIARTPHALLFASEIKAILKHPDISPVLKESGLLELFALAPARTPGKTLFSGIEELKPGECMIYSPLGTYIHRYWQYESPPAYRQSGRNDRKAELAGHRRHASAARVRRTGMHVFVGRLGFEYTVRHCGAGGGQDGRYTAYILRRLY